jgi:hypothetical protein
MSSHSADANLRPPPDRELVDIAHYVVHETIQSHDAVRL